MFTEVPGAPLAPSDVLSQYESVLVQYVLGRALGPPLSLSKNRLRTLSVLARSKGLFASSKA